MAASRKLSQAAVRIQENGVLSGKIDGLPKKRKGIGQMGMGTQTVLAGQVEAAAKAAGLVVISTEVGQDFSGNPTTRFMLALVADNSKKQVLELSDKFDFSRTALLAEVGV